MTSPTITSRDRILSAFAAYESACTALAELSYDALSVAEILDLQSRREDQLRRAPVVDHALLSELAERSTPQEIGAQSWADVLSLRLRISDRDARRRVAEMNDLTPRPTLSGDRLPPALPATAAAQAAGHVNAEHVSIIRRFFANPPVRLDAVTAAQIDTDLARAASGNSPDILRQVVKHLAALLNQDGSEPRDDYRARARGLTLHDQDAHGMSRISGYLDPETRAGLEPLLAKYGAPGMCNPADDHPCVDGEPDEAHRDGDVRTRPQRQHDALKAMCRGALCSDQLGQHNGLPVTVVVTTSLTDLHAAAGVGKTAGGTELPMCDVIRMASQSIPYLAVFDDHTDIPLYLGRAKRFATVGQRLVLCARDRGCTRPGCTQPAYHSQAHHAKADFAEGGETDVDALTLACGPDNRLVRDGGWKTMVRTDGRVEWIPPPLLDTGQDRVNHYWHPEDLLRPDGNDP